jgi:hypothetical protein
MLALVRVVGDRERRRQRVVPLGLIVPRCSGWSFPPESARNGNMRRPMTIGQIHKETTWVWVYCEHQTGVPTRNLIRLAGGRESGDAPIR